MQGVSQEDIYRGKSSEALSSVVYDVACVAKVCCCASIKCSTFTRSCKQSHMLSAPRASVKHFTQRSSWKSPACHRRKTCDVPPAGCEAASLQMDHRLFFASISLLATTKT